MGKAANVIGYVALGLAIATLITGNEWLLAGFMGTIGLLWVLTIRLIDHLLAKVSCPVAVTPQIAMTTMVPERVFAGRFEVASLAGR